MGVPVEIDISLAKDMKASGRKVSEIARHFGVSDDLVRCRLDPEYAKRRRERARCAARERRVPKSHSGIPKNVREDAEKRLAEIPPDTRDLTARIFGDPLPGRSALDRARAGH